MPDNTEALKEDMADALGYDTTPTNPRDLAALVPRNGNPNPRPCRPRRRHQAAVTVWSGSSRTSTAAHKKWRKKVLDRDGWACRQCGVPANQADHIRPWSTHPHLEHDLSNGQALCHQHHVEKTLREAAAARALKTRNRPLRSHPSTTLETR